VSKLSYLIAIKSKSCTCEFLSKQ